MKKIGFFIGHECDVNKAKLLCETLRDNTTLARSRAVVAVLPEHLNLAPDLPGAEPLAFDLSEAYRGIPFVDKLFAAAAFEQNCTDEYLWLDTDSCFFRDIDFSGGNGIRLNSVDMRNIGAVYGEKPGSLWEAIYRYFDLDWRSAGFVETSVTREWIYPYFNAGMVVVREPRGLFGETRRAIIALLGGEDIRARLQTSAPERIFFHQAVFSCTALKLYAGGIEPLPCGANYPLHLHGKNPLPLPLEDVRSIRYDTYFDANEAPAVWRDVFRGRESGLRSCWYYPG